MMSWKSSKNILNSIASVHKLRNWTCRNSANFIQQNKKHTTQSTVDTSQINIFSKHMKEWWKPDGCFELLHRYNIIRVPFVRDGLVQCSTQQREIQPLKNKHILDVGCGGGILSEALARLGAIVTGIDASKEVIDVAKAHADISSWVLNNKPSYHNSSIEEHAKQFLNHYDGVVASEVIEHVNNPELFVKSCVSTLKPGGRIFFTTPNKTRISQFATIFLSENILKFTPKGTHQYEKFITPNELTFILERNNCLVESIYGIQYNPITQRWSFTKYQHLMYALQAIKLS